MGAWNLICESTINYQYELFPLFLTHASYANPPLQLEEITGLTETANTLNSTTFDENVTSYIY